jgi:tripartite-type tricarboxylate transporter receptor subunit TctC
VTSDRRYSGLLDVPTIAESGVPGYQASSWNAVAAPAKTPKAVIDLLNREVNAAVSAPDVRKRLGELGVEAGRNARGSAQPARVCNRQVERRHRARGNPEAVAE